MRTLEVNGSRWRSQRDFYDALSALLGSVERHSRHSGAFLDAMIYYPGLAAEQPPYEIVIRNPSDELRPFLCDFSCAVAGARQQRSADPNWGDDVEVMVTVK
ncbi:MAG TPA: hypothetical protein VI168_15980 [Croceibacterium sp.]